MKWVTLILRCDRPYLEEGHINFVFTKMLGMLGPLHHCQTCQVSMIHTPPAVMDAHRPIRRD